MSWSVTLARSLNKDQSLIKHKYITTICQIAIALCLTTVLLASFLIRGFEEKIESKIFNFWSHIRVYPISMNASNVLENSLYWTADNQFILEKNPNILSSQQVVNKGVILKSKESIEGIVLKGIELDDTIQSYNFTSKKNLKYQPNEIPLVLSTNTLQRLNSKIGDKIFIHIIDSQPLIIPGRIINTFFTNIEEFDNQIALSDITMIQKLNHWTPNQISWIEIMVKKKESIQQVSKGLYNSLQEVNADHIYNLFPQIFDWLSLMKRNELIIMIVMQLVAVINIISTISIFILEKTQFIGMLKVLGASNKDIQKILFYQIGTILARGIIVGNILAFLLAAFLYYFEPIKLDPSIYYIDYAPISVHWNVWLFMNILTVISCLLAAYFPLKTITKISPVKVAEFK
jgi:lipoprotein-releasing system permease protein